MNILDPLLDQISDGIVVSDADSKIVYINPAAERLLDVSGLRKEEINICRLLCGQLFCSGSEDCAQTCILRNSDSQQTEVTFKGRHGPHSIYGWRDGHVQRRQEWKHLRVRCLKVENPLLVCGGAGRHVTLIEDASAEVELQKRKEDWRNMIAHDLRTPMTNIHAVLAVFEGYKAGQALSPRDVELIVISLRSCRRMEELLDLYLDLAKIDSGAMPVHMEDLALARMIADVVREQEAQAARRRIAVGVEIPLDLNIRADVELFFRVCQNLVSNSLKYVQEGGRLSITARAQEDGSVVVSFSDNGPGIAAETLPLIFDRFYQVCMHRKGQMQGNGLGLIFCHEALKAMGGNIDVESDVGKGAEFRVRLPAGASHEAVRS